MEHIKFPILFTTGYLVVYSLLPFLGGTLDLMITLFVCSPFLVVWMVIRVLKDGTPSVKKFNDGHFYEDWDYKAIPES